MKKLTLQNVLRMISGFLAFFLTIGFAISCCMMLFLNVLADTMNLTFTATNIAAAAKITLVNVLLIAVIFTLVDHIRRKISVDRPVKIITDATEKFMKGDTREPHESQTKNYDRKCVCQRSMSRYAQRDS